MQKRALMNTEKTNFGRYGKIFQEGLVQLIFQDRPFADQITEVLDVHFLELEYLQVVLKKILDYRDRYQVHPSFAAFDTILNTELCSEEQIIQTQVKEYFEKIHISELSDVGYIKETSLDFCRKQNLKEAMLKSVSLLQNSSFDEISTVINDALKLGSSTDFGYDYLTDFEARFVPKHRKPVSTGWKDVDSITGGGLGKSELGVVVAPTGAGKSMVLVHLGAAALKEGKTVVHYTMELQDTVIAGRYDSCITGYPLSDLLNFKEEIYESVKEVEGKLIVKEYPTKSASTNTIKNHLSRLIKRGITPALIIVDYADLLKPIVIRKEKRDELGSIYEELRAMSTEFQCPIWTASQTNRSGLNAEVITMEQISEAFNKCFVADFIMSVSRTVEDKQSNQGKIFIAKNRNGPDGMIYNIFMDTSNVCIKILPKMNNINTNGSTIPLNPVKLGTKEQRELLNNKYKNFRNK
tara:strand:+ start:1074 stop:2471 length:1398 start_codon:yes stop_codon:yes gene_type:complete